MSMKNRHVLGEAVRHLILIILALYTLAPLLFLFVNAFKSNNEIIASPVALPEHWTLQYIKTAMEAINFGKALGLTFIITFFSILLLVIVSSFAAWAMVRSKTILSNIVFLCFTAAMLVPFQSLMYPLLSVFEKNGTEKRTGTDPHVRRFRTEHVRLPVSWLYQERTCLSGRSGSAGWSKPVSDVLQGRIPAVKGNHRYRDRIKWYVDLE